MKILEPYLYEPVESYSNDISEDDDSQDNQRLLSTWYRNVKLQLLKHKDNYLLQ